MICDFLYFFPQTDLEATPPNQFLRNGLNDVVPRIDVPFAVKIETFSNPDHQAPKTAKIWHFWGGT